MPDCEKISDLLIDYINRRLTQNENSEIIVHLAECPSCRKEVSELIKIRNMEQSAMGDIPDDILNSAFDRIPEKEITLDGTLNSGSVFMALDLIRYSLSAARQTLQLARQAI